MPESEAVPIPMRNLGALSKVGPIDRDIDGKEYGGIIRGPFDIVDLDRGVPTYPTLWAHQASRERRLVVYPDSQAVIRQGADDDEQSVIDERALKIWKTASHCHFNRDFRFNSQSTAASWTPVPAIGGRAWPSVIFSDPSHAKLFVLSANSTLGLLCYWWHANKQQAGRGSITVTSIPTLPTYDFSNLTAKAKDQAENVFDVVAELDLSPAHELDHDAVRQMLDEQFLGKILGIPERIVGMGKALDLLRRKLAKEPSIRGNK